MLHSEEINNFYREKLSAHGASARGVGWRDEQAQRIRLQQLIKVIDPPGEFSLNDLGCGTGELIQLLRESFPQKYKYVGYDILDEMIDIARDRFKETEDIHFFKFEKYDQLRSSDYTVSSGIFNFHSSIPDDQWQAFIIDSIQAMNKYSRKGFAFNALTKYSDKEFMRPDLFYSDPLYLFDYCKRNFSRNVALLHDYEIYDFTIIVRK